MFGVLQGAELNSDIKFEQGYVYDGGMKWMSGKMQELIQKKIYCNTCSGFTVVTECESGCNTLQLNEIAWDFLLGLFESAEVNSYIKFTGGDEVLIIDKATATKNIVFVYVWMLLYSYQ